MKEKLTFSSKPQQLGAVRQSVRAFLQKCDFDESTIELLVLALDEACTNIIRHAYVHQPRTIRLEMQRLHYGVRLTLRDYGRSCEPGQIRSRALDDIRPGGVGVHIIREVFDAVKYEPRPRGTKLTLEKNFAQRGCQD